MFQLYYRAIREIQVGEEMLLYAKEGLFGDTDFSVFQKKLEGKHVIIITRGVVSLDCLKLNEIVLKPFFL